MLHPVPVGIVPCRHRLADARSTVAETDVATAFARISELCKSAVFEGFDYGSRSHFSGDVSGSLTPAGVAFRFVTRYEGSNIAYQFDGNVANDAMDGTVTFGTSTVPPLAPRV